MGPCKFFDDHSTSSGGTSRLMLRLKFSVVYQRGVRQCTDSPRVRCLVLDRPVLCEIVAYRHQEGRAEDKEKMWGKNPPGSAVQL